MKKKTSSARPRQTAAKRYVDDQLAVMAKYGHKPRLTKKDYKVLVAKIERATGS
jgi:hypothetical protein